MPLPCSEQINAAIVAALQAIDAARVPGFAADRFELRRIAVVTTDELLRLVVYPEPPIEQQDFSGERNSTMRFTVEVAVVGRDDVDAQQQAAILSAEVKRALFADVTLGGLARDLRTVAEPAEFQRLDVDSGEEDPVAAFADPFEVDFATDEVDLTVFA